MEGLTVEVAGATFGYRVAVHDFFPDVPRWHAGLHEGQVLWGCREGEACFLILDYRRRPHAGACRIEIWEPAAATDAPVMALLALADTRPSTGEGHDGASLKGLVTRIAEVGAPA